MRKTAYFSLALLVAAVVFVARFGVQPESRRPDEARIAAGAPATVVPTSTLSVIATPTLSPTAALPVASAVPTFVGSALRVPPTSDVASLAMTPDVLAGSGADRPATPVEPPDQQDHRSRALSLRAPTSTPVPTGPPLTAKRKPAVRPPTATAALPARSNPVEAISSAPDTGPALPPERIVAPTIGLDSKIIPAGWHQETHPDGSKTSEWDVASFAVSWHKTSAKLGDPGNTVLTGHNNIEGEVFRHLEHFNVGDPITVYAGGRAHHYRVTDKFILRDKDVAYEQRLDNAKWIGHFPDERITLVSCWPYAGNTHRIFIIAKPVAQG